MKLESGTKAELIFYNKGTKLGEVPFSVSLSYEDTVELFNELFEEDYNHVMLFLMSLGIFIDPFITNKIALIVEEGNMSRMWIVVKEES